MPLGRKAFVIGSPEYSNLGDSAITIAEMLFLKKCGYSRSHIKEFTQSEYTRNLVYFARYLGKSHLICGVGGGNMGNLWYPEELFRYSFIDAFPDNPIIIFPQTIYFTEDEQGRRAQEKSVDHYDKHKRLTIVAREQKTFEIMTGLYQNAKILPVPDIVLSTKMEDYGVSAGKRLGALLVFRSDKEKVVSDEDKEEIQKYFKKHSFPFHCTDMYASVPVTKENRMVLVRSKMQEFADSKIVITDRLHGMIFSVITNTPCVVFGNNHHKIKGTYEWLSYLPSINFVQSADEAIKVIPSLLEMQNCKYDNQPLIEKYQALAKEIGSYVD